MRPRSLSTVRMDLIGRFDIRLNRRRSFAHWIHTGRTNTAHRCLRSYGRRNHHTGCRWTAAAAAANTNRSTCQWSFQTFAHSDGRHKILCIGQTARLLYARPGRRFNFPIFACLTDHVEHMRHNFCVLSHLFHCSFSNQTICLWWVCVCGYIFQRANCERDKMIFIPFVHAEAYAVRRPVQVLFLDSREQYREK